MPLQNVSMMNAYLLSIGSSSLALHFHLHSSAIQFFLVLCIQYLKSLNIHIIKLEKSQVTKTSVRFPLNHESILHTICIFCFAKQTIKFTF